MVDFFNHIVRHLINFGFHIFLCYHYILHLIFCQIIGDLIGDLNGCRIKSGMTSCRLFTRSSSFKALIRPWSKKEIFLSSLTIVQASVSDMRLIFQAIYTWDRSSAAEPLAICKKRMYSAIESLPAPSAILEAILRLPPWSFDLLSHNHDNLSLFHKFERPNCRTVSKLQVLQMNNTPCRFFP